MAGTWIIMKHDLQTSPEVRRITRRTSASSTHETIGRLHAVWSWADIHSEDGVLVADPEDIDSIAACDGFADAMVDAGWLEVGSATGRDTVCFPNFGDHNGKTAKRRLKESARKGSKRAMSAKCPQNVRNDADKMRNTEQNRTEQDKEEKKGDAGASGSDGFDWQRDCPSNLNTQAVRDALADWFEYRREHKLAKWKPSTIKKQLHKYAADGPAAFVAAVDHSIRQQYQGLYAPSGGTARASPKSHAARGDSYNHAEDMSWLTGEGKTA